MVSSFDILVAQFDGFDSINISALPLMDWLITHSLRKNPLDKVCLKCKTQAGGHRARVDNVYIITRTPAPHVKDRVTTHWVLRSLINLRVYACKSSKYNNECTLVTH